MDVYKNRLPKCCIKKLLVSITSDQTALFQKPRKLVSCKFYCTIKVYLLAECRVLKQSFGCILSDIYFCSLNTIVVLGTTTLPPAVLFINTKNQFETTTDEEKDFQLRISNSNTC